MNRWRWLLLLIAGVILLGATGYWGYNQFTVRKQLETALSNKYYRSFYDTLNNMQNMEVLLSKLLIAQAPQQDIKLLTEIWQRANAAQANLNQLPLSNINMGRTSKFLTQVGDYSFTLSNKVSAGQKKNSKDWETIKSLYKSASTLNTDLQDIEKQIASGKLYLGELTRQTGRVLQKKGPGLASNNFQTVEKHSQEIPALIYDGPFSDHLKKSRPLGLTGANITADQARKRALDFFDRRYPQGNYVVEKVNLNKGKVRTYDVNIVSRLPKSDERATVSVSETGGHIVWYTNSRRIGKAGISIEQAREKAKQFLARQGYRNILSTYYEQGGDVVIFNFAPLQNGVVLYPDQIKVTVALDNGQILGTEAMSYLMNHHQRDLPRPRLTAAKAKANLSPHLKNITGGHLVLIPVGTNKEQLTYEFRGKMDNDTFLVYINALDGKEEQVLRLVRSQEGILTL